MNGSTLRADVGLNAIMKGFALIGQGEHVAKEHSRSDYGPIR